PAGGIRRASGQCPRELRVLVMPADHDQKPIPPLPPLPDNAPAPSSSQAGMIGGEPELCCGLNVRAALEVRLVRGADAANLYPPHERRITRHAHLYPHT